ncbi:MAG TPA: hypothetical protein VM537_31485 [Anaerolineae bacterium]|nr:hypothetical protein [Anaerolineae bacterium]
MTDKECCRCGIVQSIDKFVRDCSRKDGHKPFCKRCQRLAKTGKPGVDRDSPIRGEDPTPAEIAQRAAAIYAENFEREMAGEVLGEYGNAAWRVEREVRVYKRQGVSEGPIQYSLRPTLSERMNWVRVP